MNIVLIILSFYPFISLADGPENWQIGFQDPATPIMQGCIDLHHDIFLTPPQAVLAGLHR